MQFANTSFGDYLELLKTLRNEIFICLFEKSSNISEVIIKCLEARSLLRIKCYKAFYPIEGCGQWNITLFPFSEDEICIEIAQMSQHAKRRLRRLFEYNSCEGFSLQKNGGDYVIFEGFKYDIHITEIIQRGFLLLLFVDHIESLESGTTKEKLVKSAPIIKAFMPAPYTKDLAKTKLEELLGGNT